MALAADMLEQPKEQGRPATNPAPSSLGSESVPVRIHQSSSFPQLEGTVLDRTKIMQTLTSSLAQIQERAQDMGRLLGERQKVQDALPAKDLELDSAINERATTQDLSTIQSLDARIKKLREERERITTTIARLDAEIGERREAIPRLARSAREALEVLDHYAERDVRDDSFILESAMPKHIDELLALQTKIKDLGDKVSKALAKGDTATAEQLSSQLRELETQKQVKTTIRGDEFFAYFLDSENNLAQIAIDGDNFKSFDQRLRTLGILKPDDAEFYGMHTKVREIIQTMVAAGIKNEDIAAVVDRALKFGIGAQEAARLGLPPIAAMTVDLRNPQTGRIDPATAERVRQTITERNLKGLGYSAEQIQEALRERDTWLRDGDGLRDGRVPAGFFLVPQTKKPETGDGRKRETQFDD